MLKLPQGKPQLAGLVGVTSFALGAHEVKRVVSGPFPMLHSTFHRPSSIALAFLITCTLAWGEPWKPGEWPALRHYDSDHLARIALPLGGIGTGTVALGGRGELREWEIMNDPSRGFEGTRKGPSNDAPFFAVYAHTASGESVTRALIGPLNDSEYEAEDGRPADNYGLPRFRNASFNTAYPFGQVVLSDPGLPISVRVKGFNPLVPGDAEASGLPVAILSYEVHNASAGEMQVSVSGCMRNFIGEDTYDPKIDWSGDRLRMGASRNRNRFREEPGFRGIFFDSQGVDPKASGWGTMALVTQESSGVSYRTDSGVSSWNRAILDFWDNFSSGGVLRQGAASTDNDPMAALAVIKTIPPGETRTFTFLLAWHFPNRRAWSRFSSESAQEIVGNYYCTKYSDAWAVAAHVLPRLHDLEADTRRFVGAVVSSDLPAPIKEAALFNLSALRSQTVFRIATGQMMAWEGVMADAGSCFGSCTHVWNYETATAYLFGDLARTMRDVEFGQATAPDGKMSFRVMLPLSRAQEWGKAAADGQMGTIVKFYREWQLSGDRAFLDRHWPMVRAAMAYAWVPGGWDANQDGVMEGAQDNTMDVAYFGPNPQMQFWYFAALRAAARMARAEGDKAFAERCEHILSSGQQWTEQRLFNGEYYEQVITDPATHAFRDWGPSDEPPPYQLGKGCLVDQLVGQSMARLCGLGDVADAAHARATLGTIMRYNFRDRFGDHFNNMRSFALGDESGLVMASWPRGRLKVPFPYFNEAMTGFEYTAAVGMIQAGMDTEALKVIAAIRSRFDGRKRSPFDEPECGFHYGRSLASWNALVAWTGFHYSAVDRTVEFGPRTGTWFWSNGSAWGRAVVSKERIVIETLHGRLDADTVRVGSLSAPVQGGMIAVGAPFVATVH